MDYQNLEVTEQGPVLRVTLNRPERLNALNLALVEELNDVFGGLRTREEIRVVVFQGAGRAFCAGLDLEENSERMGKLTLSQELAMTRRYRDVVVAMQRCPQPIIGVLNGPACGAGFALAVACDVRIATPTLRMNAAFVRIGFSGCDMGLTYFLPRMIGRALASEYMLTGRFIDAERAREMGMVSRVVEPEQVQQEVGALVDDMLATSPLGLRLTKETLATSAEGQSLEAVIAMEDRNQILCAHGEDFREAMTAFLEKRKPQYGAARG